MKFGKSMLGAALIVASGAVACSADLVGPPTLDDAQIDADIAATSGDAVASQITGSAITSPQPGRSQWSRPTTVSASGEPALA